MELEKPDLYTLSPDGRTLSLRAGRCARCGELSFPLTRYGCPKCGAEPEHVSEEAMDGRAKLLTFLTLHTKLTPSLQVPLVVGEAEIAPGMIEEVMLLGDEDQYEDEMMLQAVPVEIAKGEERVIACRFAPVEDRA
ncbi:Zn-ribbon domain-containing OB-fold protein [Pseudooceanicola sp.]|uniref:Zn-ribbon domain-containing OB-fold protein n=1 Tax=Pseudooceanicola sp. TaxID=1914328 RepID=UPI0035C774D8